MKTAPQIPEFHLYGNIEKGEDYDKVKPQYIIFLCTFGPFDRGFFRYTFGNLCYEAADLELGDEMTFSGNHCEHNRLVIQRDRKSLIRSGYRGIMELFSVMFFS